MNDLRGNSPFVKGAFLKNPVLVRAIGIGPIIGAAITLRHGLALSIIMTVLLFGSSLFGFFIGRLIPESFRAPINIILCAVLLIPSFLIAEWILPGGVHSLSVFAPLMMVNSILASYVSNTDGASISARLGDALGNAVGFSAVAMFVAFVRQFCDCGMLFGITIQKSFSVPALNLPFAGFILLGLAAALCKKLRIRYAARIVRKGGEY